MDGAEAERYERGDGKHRGDQNTQAQGIRTSNKS